MVGLERVVDSTVGVGVEQRLITAVNRGKFVEKEYILYHTVPYNIVQNINPYNTRSFFNPTTEYRMVRV
jgi:hypothetical protein